MVMLTSLSTAHLYLCIHKSNIAHVHFREWVALQEHAHQEHAAPDQPEGQSPIGRQEPSPADLQLAYELKVCCFVHVDIIVLSNTSKMACKRLHLNWKDAQGPLRQCVELIKHNLST